jgi:hypothetical protein
MPLCCCCYCCLTLVLTPSCWDLCERDGVCVEHNGKHFVLATFFGRETAGKTKKIYIYSHNFAAEKVFQFIILNFPEKRVAQQTENNVMRLKQSLFNTWLVLYYVFGENGVYVWQNFVKRNAKCGKFSEIIYKLYSPMGALYKFVLTGSHAEGRRLFDN